VVDVLPAQGGGVLTWLEACVGALAALGSGPCAGMRMCDRFAVALLWRFAACVCASCIPFLQVADLVLSLIVVLYSLA